MDAVYENNLVGWILVTVQISFNCLVGLICEEIELDELVELSILLDFSKSNVQTMVPTKKENDVTWYLAFAKDATNRHSLVPHVNVNSLEKSLLVVYQTILRCHWMYRFFFFSLNDKVIREISYIVIWREKIIWK